MKPLILAVLFTGGLFAQDAFRVQVTGHGRPMILIPGLSSGGDTWDGTVARYKDRFECHVLTLAGFAGVPRVEPGPKGMLATVRDQLADYIREKKLVKPVLVGHSLGGYIAMDFASRYPDVPGKLVIVDTYPFTLGLNPNVTPDQVKAVPGQIRAGMGAMTQEAYLHYVASGISTNNLATDPANQKRLIEWGSTSDLRSVTDALAEMMGGDLRDDLAKIKAPTMVLAAWKGSESQGATHELVDRNMRAQYAKLKGVEIYVTDNSRHFIMWDDPDWMFAHFDAFLGVI